jgi:uncharacterized protein (DUF58 family)
VLLDTRRTAYQGSGPDSAFEWAVSGAASTLAHMLERGFAVRLLTDDGNAVPGEGEGGFAGSTQESADSAGLMMDTLAVVDHSEGGGLSRAYDVLRGGNEGLLIAFFGDLDEEQAAVAARMRQRSGGAVAFVLDSTAWVLDDVPSAGADTAFERRLRLLRESGWTAVAVAPGTGLARYWQQAARHPGVTTRSAAGGGTTGGTTGFSGGWS